MFVLRSLFPNGSILLGIPFVDHSRAPLGLPLSLAGAKLVDNLLYPAFISYVYVIVCLLKCAV